MRENLDCQWLVDKSLRAVAGAMTVLTAQACLFRHCFLPLGSLLSIQRLYPSTCLERCALYVEASMESQNLCRADAVTHIMQHDAACKTLAFATYSSTESILDMTPRTSATAHAPPG